MLRDGLNALLMAIAVFLIHLPAAAISILAKLGLGPLFIAALMFPSTAKWFDKWFVQVLAYILEIAITMVVVSVGLALFKALLDKVMRTGTDHPINSFFQIIALIVLFTSTSCRTWASTEDEVLAAPSAKGNSDSPSFAGLALRETFLILAGK